MIMVFLMMMMMMNIFCAENPARSGVRSPGWSWPGYDGDDREKKGNDDDDHDGYRGRKETEKRNKLMFLSYDDEKKKSISTISSSVVW